MNNSLLTEIGKRIQNRRKQMGYTQEQLAEMMNVSIQMVSNLERGIKAIRIDNLIRLCEILEVSTDYILTGNEGSRDLDALAVDIQCLSEESRKMIIALVNYCKNNMPQKAE